MSIPIMIITLHDTGLPCITPYTHACARILAINDKHNVQLFFVALVLAVVWL